MKILLLSAIAMTAGVGIPIMAAINAGLGSKIGNPVFATVILLFVGFILASIYLLIQGVPDLPKTIPSPVSFTGGFFVVFYILSVTTIAPKIGLGNTIFLVLLGQILSTTIIDHFALFGVLKSQITWQRIAGIVLMISGIYLARRVG